METYMLIDIMKTDFKTLHVSMAHVQDETSTENLKTLCSKFTLFSSKIIERIQKFCNKSKVICRSKINKSNGLSCFK